MGICQRGILEAEKPLYYTHFYGTTHARVGRTRDTERPDAILLPITTGRYSALKASYHRLLAYAKTQGMLLEPVFSEETLLDELWSTGFGNYITEIFILVFGGE